MHNIHDGVNFVIDIGPNRHIHTNACRCAWDFGDLMRTYGQKTNHILCAADTYSIVYVQFWSLRRPLSAPRPPSFLFAVFLWMDSIILLHRIHWCHWVSWMGVQMKEKYSAFVFLAVYAYNYHVTITLFYRYIPCLHNVLAPFLFVCLFSVLIFSSSSLDTTLCASIALQLR